MRAATLFEALDALTKQRCWMLENGGEDKISYSEWRDTLMFFRQITGSERKAKELWSQLRTVKTPDGRILARQVNQSNSLILDLAAVGDFLALKFPTYAKAMRFTKEGSVTASLPDKDMIEEDGQ